MRTLLILALLPALLLAPRSAPADREQEFLDKFKAAMAIKASDEMAKLINAYEQEAVQRVIETCESISQRPTEELESLIWALRQAWKSAKKSGFPDQMYEYYSLLDPSLKREWQKKKNEYAKAVTRYGPASEAKDAPQLELLAGEFEGLAKAFEELGDRFWASQACFFAAQAVDETLRGSGADLKRAAALYGKGLELRKSMELDDRLARQNQLRYDALSAQGWVDGGVVGGTPPEGGAPPEGGQPPEGGAGGAPPGGAAAASTPASAVTAALSFELLPEVEAIERPLYTADDLYPTWSPLQLGEKGSKARFPNIADGPDVWRHGAADVRVDKNRDGQVPDEEKVPLTGKITPVEVSVGNGEEQRPWGFVMVTGLEKDTYQGIEVNLQPNDQTMLLYVLSAASMKGTLAGTSVRVIDDNMDGVYGSQPLSYHFAGLTADKFQPEMDSIVVGDEKRARPWSEFQQIGGVWWQLEPQKGGKELKATPVELRTGTLKLVYEGATKPSWLVVRGSGKFEKSFFDLAAGGSKGVQVPVGKYELFYGELRKGKKRQLMKAIILPGVSTPRWDVADGQTVAVELGEPYGFDFRTEREGDKLVVLGESVAVTGRGAERYERVWNAVPRPEMSWREEGQKRGSKPEKLDVVLDQDLLYSKGFQQGWFPLDTAFELRGAEAGKKLEVQLSQKKNPLFGKIESDWK